MAIRFETLLRNIVRNPDEPIANLSMLTVEEEQQMLADQCQTDVDIKSICIQELFEEQVDKKPDAIAVVFEDQQLTYGELNTKANQLASYLMSERLVNPDTLVGICMERSLEMIIAILSILKAGGAYVPLDPDYPKARLAYILTDANLSTVLTYSHMLERIPITPSQAVCLDDASIQHQVTKQAKTNPIPQQLGITPSNLAYVIYTSGSTGDPKGVQAPHISIYNRLNWMEKQLPVSVDDVFCQKTAFGFVDHVAEIFQALAYGCPLIIVRTGDVLEPDRFAHIIAQHRVTRLTLVPSLLKYLIENNILAKMTSLRLVISSGEALQMEEARNFHKVFPMPNCSTCMAPVR